ncbi:MAG: hypothetical protein KDK64_02410 [Chlamydiia bacterium]|nr:hypothetical protein [Chlamydiia bacterium]
MAASSIAPSNSFNSDAVLAFMQKPHLNFPFKRSDKGGTGLTYLPLHPLFKWVIKWQNQLGGECEYISTLFYKRVFEHYSVPESAYITDQKIRDTLATVFIKNNGNVASVHYPLFLEYLKGNNLSAFCANGNLFKLNVEDLFKLFTAFGEVAGYDLAIGNSDRFFPMNFQGVIHSDFKMNSGNIMIEIDESGKLVNVHLIDNAPHFLHFFGYEERNPPKSEDEEDHLDGGFLWDNDSSASETAEGPSQPPKESSSSPLPSGAEKREERTRDFHYFAQSGEANLALMAEQILIGIQNALTSDCEAQKAPLTVFFEEHRSHLLQGLISGLQRSQISMCSPEKEAIVDELIALPPAEETTLALLIFIKENLKFVQKLNLVAL